VRGEEGAAVLRSYKTRVAPTRSGQTPARMKGGGRESEEAQGSVAAFLRCESFFFCFLRGRWSWPLACICCSRPA